MRKILYSVVILLALILVACFVMFYRSEKMNLSNITDFKSCEANGYPILESDPRQCKTPDGKTYVEVVEQKPLGNELIIVDSIRENQLIKSPIEITGKARGSWFFEASFPIFLLDDQGKEIAHAIGQAQGDWMTNNFVPFKATLEFTVPTGITEGAIKFKNDNPSGDPERDLFFTIPVTFVPTLN